MREERIQNLLQTRLEPEYLEIINQSAAHHGHIGDDGSNESHFKIIIRSAKFSGLSVVQQHRLVYNALQDEFDRGLHALALETGV